MNGKGLETEVPDVSSRKGMESLKEEDLVEEMNSTELNFASIRCVFIYFVHVTVFKCLHSDDGSLH